MTTEWRCFHCDEMFTDPVAAGDHFGIAECDTPRSKMSMGKRAAKEKAMSGTVTIEIYSQIAKLIRIAETGEQWAEICRLEALAESLTS